MSLEEKAKGEPFDNGAKLPDGQFQKYAVLPAEERAKGFVRPFRDSYKHVGQRPKYPTRNLTAEEQERYRQYDYIAFEPYPASDSPVTGRYWTAEQLKRKGCGTTTRMGQALSETYARDPSYYGSTFCSGCGNHYPVAEFVWTADGEVVGS